jgi:hypothetical protein
MNKEANEEISVEVDNIDFIEDWIEKSKKPNKFVKRWERKILEDAVAVN